MKEIKIIFIALEIAALIGVAMFVFLTDWQSGVKDLVLVKVMVVLLAIYAVVCQKEQEKIAWEDEE